MELGYDKNPGLGAYGTAQYNGNIAGALWKSEGDGQQRKYNFGYDAVNRLTGAAFGQYASGSGSSAVFNTGAGVDFTVSGITYDLNGNLKALNRSGLLLNSSAPVDGLTYSYAENSNRLLGVEDSAPDAGISLGDFRDGANVSTDDYEYNVNGSLTKDLNKDISDISYFNVAELPKQVITSRGKVDYTYDALGNKAWKNVTDNSVTGKTITTYLKYLDDFVYESRITAPVDPANPDYIDDLLFMLHGEGRIRALYNDLQHPHTLTGLTYDYFIKDHLGNTRMVLTEEQKQDVYPAATMETAQAATENTYYDNIDLTRFAKSGISGYPVDEATDPNDYVAKTEGDGNNIGPSLLLKVMAGDKFTVQVSSWYKKNGASPATPADPLTALIAALAGGVSHVSPVHGTATALINSGALDPSALGFLNSRDAPASGKPKAYLNWVLLDEQLKIAKDEGGNIIAGGYSGADPVGGDEEFKTHAFANMPVKKSGYLYIYVSNETPNIDVFFDNLQVKHTRGAILEETHYYPFGLTMAGISSKALNNAVENKYRFNSGSELQNKEFSDGSGLDLYATDFRSYDPQIGRFTGIDALSAYTTNQSPYSFVQNNPLSFVDPLGLDTVRVNGEGSHKIKVAQGDVLAWTIGETTSYYTYDPNNKDAVNGFVGEGIDGGDLPEVTVSTTSNKSDANTGYDFFTKDQNLWASGVGFTLLESSRSTFRLTNGIRNGSVFSPKIYSPSLITGRGWGGGSPARITTYKVSNLAKGAGAGLVGIGVGLDAVGVYKYYKGVNDPNAFIQPVHPAKAILNTGVAAYGLWVNPAVGIIYFGTEALYPGGIKGAVKDQGKTLANLNEQCGCDASAYFY
jgi:RHS repeat-associated protein